MRRTGDCRHFDLFPSARDTPIHPYVPDPELMRKVDLFLSGLTLGFLLLLLSFVDASGRSRSAVSEIEQRADLVQRLALTDLSLFTEARYTRHPSQTDLHSAFQDHPLALEHFPSGSQVPAPRPPGMGR